ncbi:MAG: hypothetical protein MZV63_56355 [Marinilabiliales bacterium]|nr:hypothetical protein [Marinilabiliales bacterium]
MTMMNLLTSTVAVCMPVRPSRQAQVTAVRQGLTPTAMLIGDQVGADLDTPAPGETTGSAGRSFPIPSSDRIHGARAGEDRYDAVAGQKTVTIRSSLMLTCLRFGVLHHSVHPVLITGILPAIPPRSPLSTNMMLLDSPHGYRSIPPRRSSPSWARSRSRSPSGRCCHGSSARSCRGRCCHRPAGLVSQEEAEAEPLFSLKPGRGAAAARDRTRRTRDSLRFKETLAGRDRSRSTIRN